MTDKELIDGFIEELKSSPNKEWDFQSYVWRNVEKHTPRIEELNNLLNEDGRVTLIKEKRPSPFTYRFKDFQETKQEELFEKDERRKDRTLELAESANEIADQANVRSIKSNRIAIAAIVVTVLLNIGGVLTKNNSQTDILEEQTRYRDSLRTVLDQQKSSLDSLRNVLIHQETDTGKKK